MHWKTKKKILTTVKLYLTEKTDSDYFYEIRFQLPDKEYVIIDFRDVFPSKIYYKSLENNGFNYDHEVDDQIIKYGKRQTLTYLEKSKKLKSNITSTIETVIELVTQMENLK